MCIAPLSQKVVGKRKAGEESRKKLFRKVGILWNFSALINFLFKTKKQQSFLWILSMSQDRLLSLEAEDGLLLGDYMLFSSFSIFIFFCFLQIPFKTSKHMSGQFSLQRFLKVITQTSGAVWQHRLKWSTQLADSVGIRTDSCSPAQVIGLSPVSMKLTDYHPHHY